MALLDGKQLRDESLSLDKLQGYSGQVTFTASATMSFSGASLTRDTADIQNLTDVVNKEYVDSVAAGLDPKESVKVIATASITLNGTQSIDGYLLSAGERVLVNGQVGATANGIYDVVAGGDWTRSSDSDGSPSNEVSLGNFVFVEEGTTYGGSGWVLSITDSPDPDVTPDVDTQVWTQFSAAGYYTAGTGLTLTGSEFSITNTSVTSGSYGSNNETLTLTVNPQGQLTAVSATSISITAGQVSDFTSASETAIFTDANFVDGITVTFSVTAGDSVTAEVVDGSLGTNKLDTNGAGATAGYILSNDGSGNFTWILNDVGDITAVTAGSGLTGGGTTGAITLDVRAENGLNVDGTSDAVELGGTLTKNTTITGGQTYNLNLGGSGGGALNKLITSSEQTNILSTATFSLEFGSLGGAVTGTITDSSSNGYGLVYTADYSPTFVSYSLVTKGYVDDAIADSTTGVSDITAGNGLTQIGTTGSVTLNVVGGTGINANPDDIEINFTQVAAGLDGAGLVANGTVLDVNLGAGLTFSGDAVVTDTAALAGDGLSANGAALDVNVNADSLEIVTDTLRLKDTVTGDRTFSGSIVIGGNLTVSGTTSTINTENLYVEDNIITLNAGVTGSPTLDSGIEINRGTDTYAKLTWNETDDYWVAGLSGSENYVITQAGNGLTQSFDTLSLDFTSVATSLEGNGLTANAGVLSVNTSNGVTIINDSVQLADTVSGLGLTFSAGVINVGAGTGITVNADDVAIDFVSITGQGLTQSGGVISVDEPNLDYTTIAGNLDGTGLVVVGSELAVNTGLGMTISADAIATDLLINGGLTYSGNQLTALVDGTTIIINPTTGQLEATTQGDIQGVTAGAGLTGGGSSGFVTLDVNPGDGIEIVGDAVAVNLVNTDSGLEFVTGELQVDLGASSGLTLTSGLQIDPTAAGDGLTFSAGVFDVNVANGLTINGDNVEVDPSIAGTGLSFSAGVLSVVAGSAQPVYQAATSATQNTPNANDFNTGITITSTPNDYSRVNVYVNGQLQRLGDGVTTTDCYFGTQSGSAVNITDIEATYTLFWNGVNAGFRISGTDDIDIIYEA